MGPSRIYLSVRTPKNKSIFCYGTRALTLAVGKDKYRANLQGGKNKLLIALLVDKLSRCLGT